MCANCVSKLDVVVGTVAFGGYLFKGPMEDGLIAAGLLPERHPLAVDMRTVSFLRDLDLDPRPILGDNVVAAADRALAFPRVKVYRRTFGEALRLLLPWAGAMRSHRVPAVQ
jgi:hypothetical protein